MIETKCGVCARWLRRMATGSGPDRTVTIISTCTYLPFVQNIRIRSRTHHLCQYLAGILYTKVLLDLVG